MPTSRDVQRLILGLVRRSDAGDRRSDWPLFRYHCDDATFAELHASLRDVVSARGTGRLPRELGAGFCLYAAEWFRRNYSSWTWRDVLDALGAESEEPGPHLYHIVVHGLAWWRREVRLTSNRRTYLGTLICEGGLPLRLVDKEGAPLRRSAPGAGDLRRRAEAGRRRRGGPARGLSRTAIPASQLAARFRLRAGGRHARAPAARSPTSSTTSRGFACSSTPLT